MAEETIPMKSKVAAEAIPTATLTLTASEAFVVYQALLGAKDKAVLGLEARGEAARNLNALRLVAIENALRKVVAATN